LEGVVTTLLGDPHVAEVRPGRLRKGAWDHMATGLATLHAPMGIMALSGGDLLVSAGQAVLCVQVAGQ
jgi:hypothetical protein